MALASGLAVSALGGCSGSSTEPAATGGSASPAAGSPAAGGAAQAVGYNGKDNLKVSEAPMTLTLFYAFGANGAPKGDMPIWKKAAEFTNVSMKNAANESVSDEKQSFNTMMAAGKLPDLIQAQRVTLNPAIAQGALIPLDDLIAKHAPNIQQFMKDYPDAVNAGTGPDGKLYSVAGSLGGKPGDNVPSSGFFIRQDWLKKLNLKAPTTLQEYKDVLYAFRNNDPNGNGKKDEIPYFTRDKGFWTLVQLWGAHVSWYIGADDKVHYPKAEPEYKAALKELAQWYKDGLIDPEIFTRGSQARQFLLGNDTGGATIDWFASTGAINDTVRPQVPNIDFAAIAPPADVNGKVKHIYSRTPLHIYSWGISKDCKDPVAAIKYMDFFMSEKGKLLMGYGIEGEDYTLVNGKPAPTSKALGNPGGYPQYLRSIGVYEIGSYGNLDGELSTMNKQGKEGFVMYQSSKWLEKAFPELVFTASERQVIDANIANINANADEYDQSAFLGAKDVEATWEKHVDELKKMNLQAVLDVYNSAYARYKATLK
jgi:putative aldouronate transport system substrate-binding protein